MRCWAFTVNVKALHSFVHSAQTQFLVTQTTPAANTVDIIVYFCSVKEELVLYLIYSIFTEYEMCSAHAKMYIKGTLK